MDLNGFSQLIQYTSLEKNVRRMHFSAVLNISLLTTLYFFQIIHPFIAFCLFEIMDVLGVLAPWWETQASWYGDTVCPVRSGYALGFSTQSNFHCKSLTWSLQLAS